MFKNVMTEQLQCTQYLNTILSGCPQRALHMMLFNLVGDSSDAMRTNAAKTWPSLKAVSFVSRATSRQLLYSFCIHLKAVYSAVLI